MKVEEMTFKKGHKVSEETKQKLRDNAKINANYGMKGKHWKMSEEQRANLKIVMNKPEVKIKFMGKMSEERRLKLKGKTGAYPRTEEWKKKHVKRGFKLSLETRNKMSEARKGIIFSEERNRRISQSKMGHKMDDKTKEILKKVRMTQVFPIKDTSIEVKIQNFLKELNIEFFTHQYMNIEHGYQCDIFIPSKNLVIECFGDYWHKYPMGREIDTIRCEELRQQGFNVLVFWEKEIKVMQLNDLVQAIQ